MGPLLGVNRNLRSFQSRNCEPHAKFIHVGLSCNDRSSSLELLDNRSRVGALKFTQDCRGACRWLFCSTDVVFDGY